MSMDYPDFKGPMVGLAILAVPFLWFFDWAGWAWIVVAVVYVIAIVGWFSEGMKVYRANKSSGSPEPFKTDFVRSRQQAPATPARGDFNDEHVQGETIWTGSKQIRFAYRNSDGDYSDREVTVHKVVSSGSGWSDDIYFMGFCHLRSEPRTFRLDRVRQRNKVVDTATGEVGTLRQTLGVKRRVAR